MAKKRTNRSLEILDFIKTYMEVNKVSPSLQEIADGVGITALSGVRFHLRNLEKDGLIYRTHSQARSIVIPEPKAEKPVESPNHDNLQNPVTDYALSSLCNDDSLLIPVSESVTMWVFSKSLLKTIPPVAGASHYLLQRAKQIIEGDIVVKLEGDDTLYLLAGYYCPASTLQFPS